MQKQKERRKRKIVVLCGSSRFTQEMSVAAWLLERDEAAITLGLHLLPWWYPTDAPDHLAEREGVADELDELHLDKIAIARLLVAQHDDLFDAEVFVTDVGGYVGQSTARELETASLLGLPIRRYSDDPIGAAVEAARRKGWGIGNTR